jgi:hypothetical protein
VKLTKNIPALAETLLAVMDMVGHHAQRMAVALIWALVLWLALLDLTLLLVMH